jgi:hypothetical protein
MPVIHSSFTVWVEAEVLPKGYSQGRLDKGLAAGRYLVVCGKFKHQDRVWEVNGDTRIEYVRHAYDAIRSGEFPDPLILERAKRRGCLNLVKGLRKLSGPKHFYVYEVV